MRAAVFCLCIVGRLLAPPARAQEPAAEVPPAGESATAPRYLPLFPKDFYEGWTFGNWADVGQPQQNDGAPWRLQDGILAGLDKRTWIFSGVDYGDFALRLEWKISPGGNAAVGVRFPPAGDPAYTGLAIQLVDHEKYFPNGSFPRQRTGAVYDALPPREAAEKAPGEWNAMEITCLESHLTVSLNGVVVQDVDLSAHDESPGEGRTPLAERPTSGAIGFQNVRGTVQFRNLEIATLDDPPVASDETTEEPPPREND